MSVNIDPSLWRLKTGGGIPYKFKEMDGSFSDEDGSVSWKAIIRATDFVSFLQEIFPPPLVIGDQVIPIGASMPGAPGLRSKRVQFRTQQEGLPIDPFNADPAASIGTYHDFLDVTVEFGTGFKNQDPDQDDPTLFLEITGNASGEFLHTSCPKAKWKKEKNPDAEETENESSAGWADPETGEVFAGPLQEDGTYGYEEETESNKDPTVPIIITVPQTDWSVKWTQVPYDLFVNTIIHRLRLMVGRVNSRPFRLLWNAYPETILFRGYSYSTRYTWRDDQVDTPPIQLDLKFQEKRVIWKGVIIGHNHFWRPGEGWQRLLIDGSNNTFGGWDLNFLFKR